MRIRTEEAPRSDTLKLGPSAKGFLLRVHCRGERFHSKNLSAGRSVSRAGSARARRGGLSLPALRRRVRTADRFRRKANTKRIYWRQRGPFPAGGETENGLRPRNLHHQGNVGAFARSSRDNLPSPAAGTSAGLSGRRRLALQSRRDRAMGTTTGSATPATSRSRTASARRVALAWVDRPSRSRCAASSVGKT